MEVVPHPEIDTQIDKHTYIVDHECKIGHSSQPILTLVAILEPIELSRLLSIIISLVAFFIDQHRALGLNLQIVFPSSTQISEAALLQCSLCPYKLLHTSKLLSVRLVMLQAFYIRFLHQM